MEKPLCISYIRFSSPSQSDGTSLARQLEKSRKYAKEHGLIIDDKLCSPDLGKSAYSGAHIRTGHFGRFLEYVKEGRIPKGSVLLVESLDRLSREAAYDAFKQLTLILDEGIKVITLTDGREYTQESLIKDPAQLFGSLTIMIRAREESDRKSGLIRDAFRLKREDLENEKFTANCPSWLKLTPDRKSFEILPERADIVKRIFALSYGGAGIKSITRILNEEGVPTAKTKSGWCQSTVRKILSSRSVIGEFQPHSYDSASRTYEKVGKPVAGYFPPILDEETYYAVQSRLKNGTHRAGRTAKVENVFGGITKCGYCGARMDIVTKHNRKEIARYLVCDQVRRGVKGNQCSHLSIKCNEVESAFFMYCREPEILDVLNLEGKEEQSRLAILQKQLAAKNGELHAVDTHIQLLDQDLLDITDPKERKYFRNKLTEQLYVRDEVIKAISNIGREITELTASYDDPKKKVGNILEAVKAINETPDEDKRIKFRARLRNELRQIIREVRVYPRGKVVSEDEFEKVRLKLETEIAGTDDATAEMLRHERDIVLAQMRKSHANTKDDRSFTVYFKNGNSREFKYSKEEETYRVTLDRRGNTIDWLVAGDLVHTIVSEDEEGLAAAEASQG